MPSVEQLLAQIAQLQQTILLQAQTVATLTAMLAGEDPEEPEQTAYLNNRGVN